MISCLVRSLRSRRPSMRFGVLGDVADKGRLYRARTDFGFDENSRRPTTTFMDHCRMLGLREFGNLNAVIYGEPDAGATVGRNISCITTGLAALPLAATA